MADTILKRMAMLRRAAHLAMVPRDRPERCHQLRGNRDEQFAVDLVNLQRLVFVPNHDQIPRKDDNGIDLKQVTAIKILEVVDYH